jgi:uncharacterized protein (DUF1778 family)
MANSPETIGRRAKEHRFEARLSDEDNELIEEARALLGLTRTDLMVRALRAYAKDAIAEYRSTLLSEEEFSNLLDALDAAPEPNERTRRAAAQMRQERATQQ